MAANPLDPAYPLCPQGKPTFVAEGEAQKVATAKAINDENLSLSVAKLDRIFSEANVEVDINTEASLVPEALVSQLHKTATVEESIPLIGELMRLEKQAKGQKVYPRRLLRCQHIAAFMIMNPFSNNVDVARFFGVSCTTVENIMKTDTFKALISAHRVHIEGLGQDIQEEMRATITAGLQVVQKEIVDKQEGEFALSAIDKLANRLGMGVKHKKEAQVQVNVIAADMIMAARARRLPSGG